MQPKFIGVAGLNCTQWYKLVVVYVNMYIYPGLITGWSLLNGLT